MTSFTSQGMNMGLSSKISKQQEIDVAFKNFLRNTFRHSITPILFNMLLLLKIIHMLPRKLTTTWVSKSLFQKLHALKLAVRLP